MQARAIRALASSAVVGGVVAPLLRRRRRLPPALVLGAAAAAPFGLAVLRPRSPGRDLGVAALQMWAYLAAYEMPADDREALRARVHVDYPAALDRVLGLGRIPTVRLQEGLSRPGRMAGWERLLAWCHWAWFLVPHGALAWVLARHPDRFPAAAARVYGTFDLGVLAYWVIPTAPPWYAADTGRLGVGADGAPPVRRMMLEEGERAWGARWPVLVGALGGNPLAAMPSLHLATSVAAARVLEELHPGLGRAAWAYAAVLALGLVHLGEHYVVDLLAGAALAEGVRRAGPRAAPALRGVSRAVDRLGGRAPA